MNQALQSTAAWCIQLKYWKRNKINKYHNMKGGEKRKIMCTSAKAGASFDDDKGH